MAGHRRADPQPAAHARRRIRMGGDAEEDSLAENIQRAPLHPLDQYRAFLALPNKGQTEEEIGVLFAH